MANMRAVQVDHPGGEFKLVELPIPQAGKGEVRIKVEACGICHSDMFAKEGLFPGISYPRTPGHEVAGHIDWIGEGVGNQWKKGDRVGVGWHGGHCFTCEPCRHGDFITCENARITGIHIDGGYAEYMVAPAHALARIPDALDAVTAAPLLCAGVTTFNSLRNSGARAGDLVAIQAIGGLGHLAVQYAHAMGFKTVALSRGRDKEKLARELGAHFYIDYAEQNLVEELAKLGMAKVILTTAPNAKVMSSLIEGLGVGGRLVVVGASPDPIEVSPIQLIGGRRSIIGWPSGDARDSQDALEFSATAGVKPMVETYPLEKAGVAYQHMITGKARFRAVLQM